MTSAEQDQAPVRPRRKRASEQPTNGAARPPLDPERNGLVSDPTVALTHALEELHAAARTLNLPPMRVEWAEDDPDLSELPDPDRRALQEHISSFLADYEGLRAGPIATPLNEIQPPETPDAFLVGNLIRPGTTFMLAGPPGAAKSWASRQLALAAAGGRQMFLERYPIPRPLKVLVIDEDNGPDEEWRREQTLLTFLELTRDQVANVRRVSLENVQLDEERWQLWLRGQIRLHEFDLVILDPISEMYGGKELREDPSFRSMLAFLKRLKVDFPQMATVVVHHTRKLAAADRSNQRGLEDVRGQWGQTPDVVAMLSPMAERRSTWEVHKRVPHSKLLLEQIEEGQPGEGAIRLLADEALQRSKALQNDDAVIDALRGGFETPTDISQAIGMPKTTVSGVLKRLLVAGVVEKRGRAYSVVEDDR